MKETSANRRGEEDWSSNGGGYGTTGLVEVGKVAAAEEQEEESTSGFESMWFEVPARDWLPVQNVGYCG